MKNTSFISKSSADTAEYGQNFVEELCGGDVVTLSGDLGAGKTTFSQSVLGALGAEGPFTSPTFTVIKQYELGKGSAGYEKGISRVYHIDAYRISDVDMVELGWNEMIASSDAIILVEWPEKIAALIPDQSIALSFETLSENERKIMVVGETH